MQTEDVMNTKEIETVQEVDGNVSISSKTNVTDICMESDLHEEHFVPVVFGFRPPKPKPVHTLSLQSMLKQQRRDLNLSTKSHCLKSQIDLGQITQSYN